MIPYSLYNDNDQIFYFIYAFFSDVLSKVIYNKGIIYWPGILQQVKLFYINHMHSLKPCLPKTCQPVEHCFYEYVIHDDINFSPAQSKYKA